MATWKTIVELMAFLSGHLDKPRVIERMFAHGTALFFAKLFRTIVAIFVACLKWSLLNVVLMRLVD